MSTMRELSSKSSSPQQFNDLCVCLEILDDSKEHHMGLVGVAKTASCPVAVSSLCTSIMHSLPLEEQEMTKIPMNSE